MEFHITILFFFCQEGGPISSIVPGPIGLIRRYLHHLDLTRFDSTPYLVFDGPFTAGREGRKREKRGGKERNSRGGERSPLLFYN